MGPMDGVVNASRYFWMSRGRPMAAVPWVSGLRNWTSELTAPHLNPKTLENTVHLETILSMVLSRPKRHEHWGCSCRCVGLWLMGQSFPTTAALLHVRWAWIGSLADMKQQFITWFASRVFIKAIRVATYRVLQNRFNMITVDPGQILHSVCNVHSFLMFFGISPEAILLILHILYILYQQISTNLTLTSTKSRTFSSSQDSTFSFSTFGTMISIGFSVQRFLSSIRWKMFRTGWLFHNKHGTLFYCQSWAEAMGFVPVWGPGFETGHHS